MYFIFLPRKLREDLVGSGKLEGNAPELINSILSQNPGVFGGITLWYFCTCILNL